MKIIYILLIIFSLTKCKGKNENIDKEKITTIQNKVNEVSVIDDEYTKKLEQLLEELPYNIYDKGDYSIEFKKNKTSILVEVLYQMAYGEKYISYSIRDENSLSNLKHYSIIYNDKNELVISLTTPYFEKTINGAKVVKKALTDTLFFKNDKIYSRANLESITKVDEVLIIKKDIDSLFNF